jgi:hypothetical protein
MIKNAGLVLMSIWDLKEFGDLKLKIELFDLMLFKNTKRLKFVSDQLISYLNWIEKSQFGTNYWKFSRYN